MNLGGKMKKLIFILIFVFMLGLPTALAKVPKFKVHIIKNQAPGINYSINYPVVLDYDGDGDQDVLILSKEGTLYILENITNE